MAVNQDPVYPSNIQRVEVGGAARVFSYPIGDAYAAAAISGTMAAALASLAVVWLMRSATGAGSRIAMIDRIRVPVHDAGGLHRSDHGRAALGAVPWRNVQPCNQWRRCRRSEPAEAVGHGREHV